MQKLVIYSDQTQGNLFLNKLEEILDIELVPYNRFPGNGLVLKDDNLVYKRENDEIKYNWQKQLNYHKRQKYSVKKELLAKSLGIKGCDYKIFDLTCGTAKDTLLLLSFGVHITAFERNPLVYALLLQEHLKLDECYRQKFELNFGSYNEEDFKHKEKPHALYFDPMFTDTNRKKSALKRKEMVIFDEVVGLDDDSKAYLEKILSYKVKRVVVKRHPKSSVLLNGVTASFEGKSVRYDLYCP